jgi:hypothetical protein
MERIIRNANNLKAVVRFLGDYTDRLDEIVEKMECKECEDEIIELDRLRGDFSSLYELINNISDDLNEAVDEEIQRLNNAKK